MNSVTKNRIGKNKWIVHGSYDSAIFSLYETLRVAKIYGGSCSSDGLHRDINGYSETDDHGRMTTFGRISELDSQLDEMNQQDVQETLDLWKERIEWLHESQHNSQAYLGRKDGFLIGDDNELYFHCKEKGKIHRVYGVNNTVVYH